VTIKFILRVQDEEETYISSWCTPH